MQSSGVTTKVDDAFVEAVRRILSSAFETVKLVSRITLGLAGGLTIWRSMAPSFVPSVTIHSRLPSKADRKPTGIARLK